MKKIKKPFSLQNKQIKYTQANDKPNLGKQLKRYKQS